MLDQVDLVYVIDNASTPPIDGSILRKEIGPAADGRVVVIFDSEQPPNLTRLWTVGLEQCAIEAAYWGFDEYDVAMLNDDAVMVAGWFEPIAEAMRLTSAVVAYSHPHLAGPYMKTEPDRDIMYRLHGPAFVMRGELARHEGDPLWPDITIKWWFQDTDLDWRARALGGMLAIPGPYIQNTGANSSTVGELAEQAGRDRQAFTDKYGWTPW